ncbi:hypothetical protein NLU13_9752 [Sarocladium strictum]|uniref:Aldehyde dehydrogenase domain-containing protein n=1 Tax=Sarocladium strictum TaxID=5046 RepID=A0AA39GB18_SARSR|nr:hypothetical protein NLU13_9752 [Sarocladium strictum]
MAASISAVRSAAVDGRLLNPIFRKEQLQKLHEKLSQNSADIQATILRDTGYSKAEVTAEYWLAIKLVKDAYDALSHDASLRDEYRIAKSQNAPDGREPVGIVVIEPARHAYLFSLLSALIPALAAGNCIIVKIEQDMLATPGLVLRLIGEALDSDIFLATRDQVTNDTLGHHRSMTVLQNGSPEAALASHVVSEPLTRTIAVVERDADLKLAARELTRARFALRGHSPYAPDLVYVNEWVKKNFLAALAEEAIRMSPHPHPGASGQSDRPTVSRQLQDRIAHDRNASIVSSNGTGVVVDVDEKSTLLSGEKISEPVLVVHAVRSIDAAIDIANKTGRLGAAYVFAQPAAAKYICQFINAPLSIVNHVPAKLLFHPMAPRTLTAHSNPFRPYDELLFSLTKAHFVNPPSDYNMLERALSLGKPELLEPLTRAASRLAPFKRAEGRPDIGFFEQGIITGGVMLLSTVFTVTGVCCYYWMGVPMFLRRL